MTNQTNIRNAPLAMSPEAFQKIGYQLVDQIADFLTSLPQHPVIPQTTPTEVRTALGQTTMPTQGESADQLLTETTDLLFNHSVFNGHPRFWGYITSSAAPIGALADMLAATVNANVGAWQLAPIASEIELQTVRWLAELIGFPTDGGGLLLSGGNMANITAFWAARRAKANWNVRQEGLQGRPLRVYAAHGIHTWLDKAVDLSGLGLKAVRHIATDEQGRLNTAVLHQQIETDLAQGDQPFMVIGTAGTVGTGAIDPLLEIAAVCRDYDLWFHVDGAYGALAAILPESSHDLRGLTLADSVALDPHKWLYVPLEAGCLLVKDRQTLVNAFAFHPDYYHLDQSADAPINFYEYGPQNSRGFRALKVWLALRQAGRLGYEQMIREDIALAQCAYEQIEAHPELETFTHNLSITTFRYVPSDLPLDFPDREAYLNRLNTALLNKLQQSGELFLSNAVINGAFVLRLCIVNFRTAWNDLAELPEMVVKNGRLLHFKTL